MSVSRFVYDFNANNENIAGSPQIQIEDNKISNIHLNDHFPVSILAWKKEIESSAQQYELDPNLIGAVMMQESGGQPHVISHSGAVGLMQVMPRDGEAAKFICINGPCFRKRPSINELLEPEFNIDFGARMLSGLIRSKGSPREGLKAYGPMDVDYSYADNVLSIYFSYSSNELSV